MLHDSGVQNPRTKAWRRIGFFCSSLGWVASNLNGTRELKPCTVNNNHEICIFRYLYRCSWLQRPLAPSTALIGQQTNQLLVPPNCAMISMANATILSTFTAITMGLQASNSAAACNFYSNKLTTESHCVDRD